MNYLYYNPLQPYEQVFTSWFESDLLDDDIEEDDNFYDSDDINNNEGFLSYEIDDEDYTKKEDVL